MSFIAPFKISARYHECDSGLNVPPRTKITLAKLFELAAIIFRAFQIKLYPQCENQPKASCGGDGGYGLEQFREEWKTSALVAPSMVIQAVVASNRTQEIIVMVVCQWPYGV